MSFSDEHWMQRALELALQAQAQDEVPVGAVVVHDNKIVGQGFNQQIGQNDPSAHAEIIALRDAALNLKNYRLPNTTLYVTLEPCSMCAGVLVHARVERLVFGAYEPKAGVIESKANFLHEPFLNHHVSAEGGVLQEQCSELLSAFFQNKRAKKSRK